MSSLREHAEAIWHAGLAAVSPARLVRAGLPDLDGVERIAVVGAGKAGATMALALEAALGDEVAAQHGLHGVVCVPDDVAAAADPSPQWIDLHPARSSHDNRPTEAGMHGARQAIEIAASLGEDDLLICLISGGGSALWPLPAPGISLDDKLTVTALLQSAGAPIEDLNAVRKHLSAIKGGGLAHACTAGRLVSLILSDVVDDPIDVIASGPTAADESTFEDAREVLVRYALLDDPQLPVAVRERIEAGVRGDLPETAKTLPDGVENVIVGSNALALEAAAEEARRRGFEVLDLGSSVVGGTGAAAYAHADIVCDVLAEASDDAPPTCVLSGGETTVDLGDSTGLGGRNQEFAVACAIGMGEDVLRRTCVLSGGTDGEDGPTDAAGGVVDATVWKRAMSAGLDPQAAVDAHDTYPFLDACGGLLRTGPTGTNVMDIRVILSVPQGEAS